jgi:phosphatidylglycerophosphate synthase
VTRHGSDAAALWWAPAQRARELIDAVAQGARVAAESAPLHADEFVLRAASASERARSRARHLRSLIKPTGGVIDRKLMRRLSLPITAVLLRTRVTPTQVTLLSLAVAVVAAALVAVPTPATTLAGALLHWWVRILDCVDGELARIRYQSTRVGEWLDGVGDVIGISALVLAVTWRAGGDDPLWLALGAAGIGLYLVGQVLQALATWEATGGGAVQRVRWSFQAPQAATGLDRLVAALHGMARIDFISTAYALLVVAGQFRLLVALHLAAASLAAVYFGADRLRRRASTPVSRR